MELLPKLLTVLLGIVSVFAYLALRKRRNGFRWLTGREARQIHLMDRIALTHQHSLHLVVIRDRWLAISAGPQGCQLLDSGNEQAVGESKVATTGGHL